MLFRSWRVGGYGSVWHVVGQRGTLWCECVCVVVVVVCGVRRVPGGVVRCAGCAGLGLVSGLWEGVCGGSLRCWVCAVCRVPCGVWGVLGLFMLGIRKSVRFAVPYGP